MLLPMLFCCLFAVVRAWMMPSWRQQLVGARRKMLITRVLNNAIDEASSTRQSGHLFKKERLNWKHHWYPVITTDGFDSSKPLRIAVLGLEMVLWKSNEGWRCFDEACPHRGAPLSEGRIETDGTLMCSYHAWKFRDDGSCAAVPQAPSNEKFAGSVCARSYPCMEKDGLVWIFPDASDDGRIAAAVISPAFIEELSDPRASRLPWNCRILPYGWDYFLENAQDPAHAPVAHHGIAGNRYAEAATFTFAPIVEPHAGGFTYRTISCNEDISTPEEIADDRTGKILHEFTNPFASEQINYFRAPCSNKIVTEFPGGGKMIYALYATPSRPGETRHIGAFVIVRNQDGSLPAGLQFYDLLEKVGTPIWLSHLFATFFLQQDTILLHHQERLLASKKRTSTFFSDHDEVPSEKKGRSNALPSPPYESRYDDAALASSYDAHVHTTPGPDKLVRVFRRWLRDYAGGGVMWACDDPTLPSRVRHTSELADQWYSHTETCLACRGAYNNLKSFRNIAIVSTLAVVTLDDGPRALFLALLAAGLALAAEKFSTVFVSYDFRHADND